MPEGDTVLQTAARLHHVFAGREIVRSEFRVPSLALTDLGGWRVSEVVPVGKHLLMRLVAPTEVATGQARPAREFTLHSHLMMDGMWRFQDIDRPAPRHSRVRALLETERVRAIADDVRQLSLVPTRDEHELVGHLGPDLLHPAFSDDDAATCVRRILARPDRALSSALMDQRNLAGIGNIYRNETLFLVGVAHTARVGDLDEGVVERAVATAHRLLDANKFRLPRSTTGLPARRQDSMWVYRRGGEPCRRCGTTIETGELDDAVLALDSDGRTLERDGRPHKMRIIWWCPACQPPPGSAVPKI